MYQYFESGTNLFTLDDTLFAEADEFGAKMNICGMEQSNHSALLILLPALK